MNKYIKKYDSFVLNENWKGKEETEMMMNYSNMMTSGFRKNISSKATFAWSQHGYEYEMYDYKNSLVRLSAPLRVNNGTDMFGDFLMAQLKKF